MISPLDRTEAMLAHIDIGCVPTRACWLFLRLRGMMVMLEKGRLQLIFI